MQRYLLILFVFCSFAISSILLLRPAEIVQYEAGLSLLAPEAAFAQLGEVRNYGPAEKNLALLHAQLAVEAGATSIARPLLIALVPEMPSNLSLLDDLAQIGRSESDYVSAAKWLSAAYEIEPTMARRLDLGALFRLQRNNTAEIQLLESVETEKLTLWEIDRLAQLMVILDRSQNLEDIYRRLADGQSPVAGTARQRLLAMLLDDARLPEALQVSLEWFVKEDYDSELASLVVTTFISRGATNEAFRFADYAIRTAPDSGYLLVGHFARSGHRIFARRLQDEWLLNDVEISSPEWDVLVEMASLSGDFTGLHQGLERAHTGRWKPDDVASGLRQMLRFQGPTALVPYREFATWEVGQSSPLVGAAFAVEMSQYDVVRDYLLIASARDLDEWDRSVWMSIADRIVGSVYYRELVTGPISDPLLVTVLRERIMAPSQ